MFTRRICSLSSGAAAGDGGAGGGLGTLVGGLFLGRGTFMGVCALGGGERTVKKNSQCAIVFTLRIRAFYTSLERGVGLAWVRVRFGEVVTWAGHQYR